MSVRRTSARAAEYGDRYGILKGVLFWGFLLAASFIFGLLVVSPLINYASGSRMDRPASAATQPPSQIPPSSSAPVVSAPAQPRDDTPRRLKRSEEPGITVTEDRIDQSVQRSEAVDENHPKRKRASDDTSTLTMPSDERITTDRSETTGQPTDESATTTGDDPGRERVTADTPTQTAQPEKRRTRKRRHADDSQVVKPAPKPKQDVQKGESIDP